MDLGIRGKTALVCAASKGLGKGCAVSLAREGVKVWISGRNEAALLATAKRLAEFRVRTERADVSSSSGWDRLCGNIMSDGGRLDIFIITHNSRISAILFEHSLARMKISP